MTKWYHKVAIKIGLRRPPQPSQRHIPVGPWTKKTFQSGEYSLAKLYGKNMVTTSRYTWYGFLFQNLSEQAQRIANFYFICIAIIQLFAGSPVTPALSILPLIFVLGVTMVKQGYEDWLRHRADREVNHVNIEIVTEDGNLGLTKAQDITVGDIILCRVNDTFPCDLLILSTSEPNGECLVTTSSLDGETNLKRFVATDKTLEFNSPEAIAKDLRGTITCQQPVDDLYDFHGRLNIQSSPLSSGGIAPIGPENLLLRGTRLKNTDFVYGCAVYTGQDTKMALNSKGKKTKFSQVERRLNVYLLLILCFLLISSFISTILYYTHPLDYVWFIPKQPVTPWTVVQTYLGFLVLYNYAIPISLYVTIELQKFFGSLFFEWDLELYDPKTNERAKANTSDLIEEMGQIEYLFTDKTGTLTENSMQFRRFAIANNVFCVHEGQVYQMIRDTESPPEADLIPGDLVDLQSALSSSSSTPRTSTAQDRPNFRINILFLVLSLCHTVRVERPLPDEASTDRPAPPKKSMARKVLRLTKAPKRGSTILRRASAAQAATAAVRASRRGRNFRTVDYMYQASSPDEKAFVEACRTLGVVYHGVDEHGLQVVTVQGLAVRYRLLEVLEFDATRKCMSVVLQPLEGDNEDVIVLCKGAETALIEKAARSRSEENAMSSIPFHSEDPLLTGLFRGSPGTSPFPSMAMSTNEVMKRVTEFASCGLRTLVMGARLLKSDEWAVLKHDLDEARAMLEGREPALVSVYRAIESQMTLIGCTGVEDMLQDGVPDTIRSLRKAGIQVWVLTGDKEETAVNISYSAGHFYLGILEIRITQQTSFGHCLQLVERQLERINESRRVNSKAEFGLVVDGQSLGYTLQKPLRERFLECCLQVSSVLCCRLTPLQKAEVVRLVKESRKPSPITAAIGDGANDVSMILEANISFGLFGKEGRQAVRAADYALARFRFLTPAILFHGYTYYTRVAVLVLYFFYKNILFTLPQMFYGFFCNYSATTIYPEMYLIFFNITMTMICILFYGIFELPVPRSILLAYPQLYRDIVRNRTLSKWNFLFWLCFALWHGICLFFTIYFFALTGQSSGTSDAVSGAGGSSVGDLISFGNLLTMAIFLVSNLRVWLVSYSLNWVVVLTCSIAFLLNLIMFVFINFVYIPFNVTSQLYYTWSVLWTGSGLGITWFGLIVSIMLAILPDLILRSIVDQGWQWRLKAMEKENWTDMKVRRPSSAGHDRLQSIAKNLSVRDSTAAMRRLPLDQTQYLEDTYEYTNRSYDGESGDLAESSNHVNSTAL